MLSSWGKSALSLGVGQCEKPTITVTGIQFVLIDVDFASEFVTQYLSIYLSFEDTP